MSDQLIAETSTWQYTTLTTYIHAPVGFEPTISAGEWPQTYALDRAATGIATNLYCAASQKSEDLNYTAVETLDVA
jgi:hypothetical protein